MRRKTYPEKCKHAYRKPGKAAVFCKAIPSDDMDYCIIQYHCRKTGRAEAPECEECDFRSKPAVK